jgi:S-adenosylmethionine hydrolase
MAKSNNSFIKKQKEQKKQKKKEQKQEKKIERKKNSKAGTLDNMLAYVDEFGNLSSTPIEKKEVPVKKDIKDQPPRKTI